MSTMTRTYTETDVDKVIEMLKADLEMLTVRTQAMELDHAYRCIYDITLMAKEESLEYVDIQLLDSQRNLVRAYRYTIKRNISTASQRPGENRWPRLPDGTLRVIITPSDPRKIEELERSGKLKVNWGPTDLSTDYSRMQTAGSRLYSSNSYGLRRETFIN